MSNAGWWPDPSGRHELRYHDGASWTEHVSDRGAVARDPVDSPRPPVPPPPPMPEPASAPPLISQQTPEPTSFGAPAPGGDPFAPPSPTTSAGPTMAMPSPPYVAPYDQPAPQGFPIGSTAPSPIIQEAGGPRRLWLAIAVVGALVFAGALAFLVSRDDDTSVDRQPVVPTSVPLPITPGVTGPPATEQQTTPTTGVIAPPEAGTTAPLVPVTTAPVASTVAPTAPPVQGVAPVGSALTAEGSIVRVNRVTPNVPVDEFFAPDAPATVTAVEIEACAGPDGFGFNTFSWTAFQADNTTLENFFFGDDVQSVQLAPGGCARGTVTFVVPGGGGIAQMVLTGATFDEVGRWTVADATEPTDRLVAPVPPTVIPVGETATVGAGHTVTLRSVTDNTPPIDDFFAPDPGRQYSQLDVEMCAGTESLTVNGLYWFGVSTDSWMGTSALLGDTLPLIDLAAGQCAAGILQIDLPAGSVITQVVYVDEIFAEQVRWQMG